MTEKSIRAPTRARRAGPTKGVVSRSTCATTASPKAATSSWSCTTTPQPALRDRRVEYITDDARFDAAIDAGLKVARALVDGHLH